MDGLLYLMGVLQSRLKLIFFLIEHNCCIYYFFALHVWELRLGVITRVVSFQALLKIWRARKKIPKVPTEAPNQKGYSLCICGEKGTKLFGNIWCFHHLTVTDFARFLGMSGSLPRVTAR